MADWQLANPSAHGRKNWTWAAGDAGFMALAGILGHAKYREAMLAAGETNQWQPGPKFYDADDHCIGQTYAELYLLYREPRMIKPVRERFDANSWFSRMQTTFTSEDKSPLTVAVGLAERPGQEKPTCDVPAGWVSYWQPEDAPKGTMGVAIMLKPGSLTAFTNDNPNLPESAFAPLTKPSVEDAPPVRNMLAVTRVEVGQPLVYYFGACWDRSGDFTNAAAWENHVKQLAVGRAQPLVVAIAGK